MKGLNAVAPEVRYRLARAVNLRHVPELHFHYDDSVDRGERIDNLLRDLPDTGDDAELEQAVGWVERSETHHRVTGVAGTRRVSPLALPILRTLCPSPARPTTGPRP